MLKARQRTPVIASQTSQMFILDVPRQVEKLVPPHPVGETRAGLSEPDLESRNVQLVCLNIERVDLPLNIGDAFCQPLLLRQLFNLPGEVDSLDPVHLVRLHDPLV